MEEKRKKESGKVARSGGRGVDALKWPFAKGTKKQGNGRARPKGEKAIGGLAKRGKAPGNGRTGSISVEGQEREGIRRVLCPKRTTEESKGKRSALTF